MILFFALLFVAAAVAGFCAFVIFWPLTLVHVRDRHGELGSRWGEGAFLNPQALGWLLKGGYRGRQDPSLTGLAAPARIALVVIFAALGMAALLWLLSKVMP